MWTRSLPALALALGAAAAFAGEPPITAAQIVERNAAARGGLAAWRKLESMAWAGHLESATHGGRVPFVLEQQRPDRTRFELTIAGQTATRVFDGTAGWKVRAGSNGRPEVQPFTSDEVKFARDAPIIEGPLMDLAAKGATVTLAGVQQVEGRDAYLLELRLPSGTSGRVAVDAGTFLEVRHDREFTNAQGVPAVTSVYYSDYRVVDGLHLPFAIETATANGKRDRLVIERIALNPHVDARVFSKPEPVSARPRGVTVDARAAGQPGRTARAR